MPKDSYFKITTSNQKRPLLLLFLELIKLSDSKLITDNNQTITVLGQSKSWPYRILCGRCNEVSNTLRLDASTKGRFAHCERSLYVTEIYPIRKDNFYQKAKISLLKFFCYTDSQFFGLYIDKKFE